MKCALVSPSVLSLGKTMGSEIYMPFVSMTHHGMTLYLDDKNFLLGHYEKIAFSCEHAKFLLKLMQVNSNSKFKKINANIFSSDMEKTEVSILKELFSDKNLLTSSDQNYIPYRTEISKHDIRIYDHPTFSSMFSAQKVINHDILNPLLLKCLKHLVQSKPGKRIENLHNDVLKQGLSAYGTSAGFTVSDQPRVGASASGGVGSLDLYVTTVDNDPFCVIECLVESSFGIENKKVNEHFNKLISNYDKVGFQRNYLITYCEAASFMTAFQSYQKLVDEKISSSFFTSNYTSNKISILDTKVANIKLLVSNHLREDVNVQVFHYFVDLSIPKISKK